MEFEFDEDKAIKYIQNQLPEGVNYDGDDILNVIDIIFDYYEDNDLLDIDFDIEGNDDNIKADLIAHVSKMLSKDSLNHIKPEHIAIIVNAELEYEESIGFDD